MLKLNPCPSYLSVCPRPSSFDAGSFVGGMALVIGLAVAGLASFFIYKYYMRRSSYSSV